MNNKPIILFVTFLLFISGIIVFVQLNTPSITDIETRIINMTYALEIHQWYVEHDYYREYTGSVEWHMVWVETYNNTINILESYKQILLVLGKR